MIRPTDSSLELFYQGYEGNRGKYTWAQLCQMFWSFGKLNLAPKEEFIFDWEDDFIECIQRVDGQGISNVLWAYARIEVMPSGRFLRAWMDVFSQSAHRYMGQEFANIIWAWSRLDIYPGEDALDQWYRQYKIAFRNRDRYPFYPVSSASLRRFGMELIGDEDENDDENSRVQRPQRLDDQHDEIFIN